MTSPDSPTKEKKLGHTGGSDCPCELCVRPSKTVTDLRYHAPHVTQGGLVMDRAADQIEAMAAVGIRQEREIEELRERVKDLQQFHDWAEPQVHDHGRDVLEIERLRAALEHYGRHIHPNCHDLTLKEDGSFGPRNGCLCGFDPALSGESSAVETTDVRIKNLTRALHAKQAKIDALMLEFYHGEMQAEQNSEWAEHQQRSPEEPSHKTTRDDDAMVREFMLQVQELAEPDLEQPDTRRYTLTELEDCMRSAIGNRRAVEPRETTMPHLLDQFTEALKADPDLAWSWHCNLAMPIMDRVKCSHTAANEAAADLMRHLFHIDIRSNSCWAITVRPVEPAAECDHPRSELLARKGDQFEMRKCLDCTKIFRVRLSVKASELLPLCAHGNVAETCPYPHTDVK